MGWDPYQLSIIWIEQILRWGTSAFFWGGGLGVHTLRFFSGWFAVILQIMNSMFSMAWALWQVTCRQEGVNEAQQLRPQMWVFVAPRCVPSQSLTWNLEISHLKRRLDTIILRFHVKLWGCTWRLFLRWLPFRPSTMLQYGPPEGHDSFQSCLGGAEHPSLCGLG